MLSEARISVHHPRYMYMEPASTFEITSLSLCGLIEAITVTPQLIPFRMLSNYIWNLKVVIKLKRSTLPLLEPVPI